MVAAHGSRSAASFGVTAAVAGFFIRKIRQSGKRGLGLGIRGLEGADARSGDPAIDPDDAARWPRLTCHTPPTTRGVTGDQRLIVRTVLINGRVPQRVALLPV